MIDARNHHDPHSASGLVAQAIAVCGTQAEAAKRLGVSREYLRQLANGKPGMSYALQVAFERLSMESINRP